MEFDHEICAILTIKSGKKTNDGKNRTAKSRNNQNARRKRIYNYQGIFGEDTIKFSENLDIQTYHLIPVRRPGQVIVNKKKKIELAE